MRTVEVCGVGLETVPRAGIGVDRSQIHEMLKLTPSERIDRARREVVAIERFIEAFI